MSETANSPIVIDHPTVGRMRLLISFPQNQHEFLAGMIADGSIRCISHEGSQFVALEDVEPYSFTELDIDELSDRVITSAEISAGAKLLETIKARTDAAVQSKRAKLVGFLPKGLGPPITSNPFGQADWAGFWQDVASTGATLAGEAEARRIDEAFAVLGTSAENGTIDQIGFSHFHKELLALAHPELEQRFDEIWSPGRGYLELPNDPKMQVTVLAILRRLTRMFSGYRGAPEGSETPQHMMGEYLRLMKLKPAL